MAFKLDKSFFEEKFSILKGPKLKRSISGRVPAVAVSNNNVESAEVNEEEPWTSQTKQQDNSQDS